MTKLQCCNSYFKQAGWHCSKVSDTSTDSTLYISTPIVLSGGKPLDFYVQRKGSIVVLSDDGITMFALRSLGFNLTDKRYWKGLENIARRHNFTLTENGEFEAEFDESTDATWGSKMLLFCADIHAWEKEHSSQGDTDFSLTDHVEAILRRMRPDRLIENHATVKVGNAELAFDFKWGHLFVDAIRPSNQAVNARLRKGILMHRIEEDANVLFIVDDRRDVDKARQELSVLAGVANAIALTDFEQLEDYSL